MGFPKRKESGADFDNFSDEPFIPEYHHLAVNDSCERSTPVKSHHQPKRLRESEKKPRILWDVDFEPISALSIGIFRRYG
jgi:hypothetical protein